MKGKKYKTLNKPLSAWILKIICPYLHRLNLVTIMENYTGEELQVIIEDLVRIMPDVATADIDALPIMKAAKALTYYKYAKLSNHAFSKNA